MLEIMANDEKAFKMAENAYKTVVEKFSIQVFVKNLNSLYRELAQAAKSS